MQLALYLEHGEQFARAALKLPQFTTVDIDSILLDCVIEVLPVTCSNFLGPDHLPGIEFPYPEFRVVFRLKDRPMVAAVYGIDVFVTDAMLSLVNRALGHNHIELNRRYAQIERYIATKQNGLLELVGCSHKALIDRITQAFVELRSAYLDALDKEGCLPVPRHT
ncbi:hypothetical protein L4X63_12450 [Geomonas sp. Red32]|uniref:hypothetical protein n=1 Tax=Geomonas sp. Red32 TaxID=2912856 RepID=UPI00202CFB94|nr:hypothetical protein [Geomonas sp. Red32]MCM0082400.1 hypothetical protein [Geomonas sp. Red32]